MGVEDYNKQQLERLREHKIAFDQEAMWDAMQKKKKRRGAFFFFTMALVALAIVFFACALFFRYNGENSNYNGENTSINKLSNKINIENEGKTVDNSSELTDLDFDKNKISDISKTELNASNESNESKEATIKLKGSFSDTDNNANTREISKRNLAKVYESKSDDGISKSVNKSTNTQNQSSQSGDVILTTMDDDSINSKKVSQFNIIVTIPKSQNEGVSKKSENSTLGNLINIQPLKIYEFPYLESLEGISIDLGELEMKTPPITEVIKEPKSRFHIGIYGGVGYLFRQTSIENKTLELNNETLEEVSTGLELKYQLTPRLFVRSGVEYWHATERRETSSYSIMNASDLDTFVPGVEEGIIISTSSSMIHTIYKSYNIPVILGWNTNNDKWNIFAEAGLLYNFKTDRKRAEIFENRESDRYQIGSRSRIYPIAGIGLSFNPTNKIELFARSNWRGRQFVTLEETPESLKFGALRTQVGLRIGL
jgi:hypothetical protein